MDNAFLNQTTFIEHILLLGAPFIFSCFDERFIATSFSSSLLDISVTFKTIQITAAAHEYGIKDCLRAHMFYICFLFLFVYTEYNISEDDIVWERFAPNPNLHVDINRMSPNLKFLGSVIKCFLKTWIFFEYSSIYSIQIKWFI